MFIDVDRRLDGMKRTTLMIAALAGNHDEVERLLADGADPNLTDKVSISPNILRAAKVLSASFLY